MAKKSEERVLSESEKRRLEIFNKKNIELQEAGYTGKDLTTTAGKANIVGPWYGLILSVPFILIFFLTTPKGTIHFPEHIFLGYLIFMMVFIALVVVHELIHGITWSRFSKNGFKDIEFGVIWKMLTPYCTCKEPLRKIPYITGVLMPCIVLGIIPSIIACIMHSLWLLCMGVIMMLSAGGDLLIAKMILSNRASDKALYLDHPIDIGLKEFDKVE